MTHPDPADSTPSCGREGETPGWFTESEPDGHVRVNPDEANELCSTGPWAQLSLDSCFLEKASGLKLLFELCLPVTLSF